MRFKFYLNFDEETGKAWKITTTVDDKTPYMEIDKGTYTDFLNLKKRLKDYIVVPSSKDDVAYELKFIHKDLDEFDIEKSIHRIPKNLETETNSVIIKQNTLEGFWEITITDSLKSTLSSTTYYHNKGHDIYVTYKDDPNILLDTLRIEFSPLLHNGVYRVEKYNKKVAQNNNVSVYCGKLLDNYSHVTES